MKNKDDGDGAQEGGRAVVMEGKVDCDGYHSQVDCKRDTER